MAIISSGKMCLPIDQSAVCDARFGDLDSEEKLNRFTEALHPAIRYGKEEEEAKATGGVPNAALPSAICHGSKLNNVVGSVILESGPSRRIVNLSLVRVIG
jgi:hypothetical protein